MFFDAFVSSLFAFLQPATEIPMQSNIAKGMNLFARLSFFFSNSHFRFKVGAILLWVEPLGRVCLPGASQSQPTEDHADQPHNHGHDGPG